MIDIG